MTVASTSRVPEASVDPLFLERWSPRSFLAEPLTDDEVASLFEAARWSPSCFNEQPWHFVYARSEADRARMAELLVEGNRTWASAAPLLGVVFASKKFARNGDANRWAAFDAGAASFALTLQAHKLGLGVHFMGGFDASAALAAFGLSADDYEAMAAFAVGRRGPVEALPENLQEREAPSARKPLAEIAREGGWV